MTSRGVAVGHVTVFQRCPLVAFNWWAPLERARAAPRRTLSGNRAMPSAKGHFPQLSLDLASFTIATRADRASAGVVTGFANAKRIGRGPSAVFADISKQIGRAHA